MERLNLQQAFPPYLNEDVRDVLKIMPSYLTNNEYFIVKMYGGKIRVPERIECEELSSDVMTSLTVRQKKIVLCIYSRHFDGYIREKNLSGMLKMQNIEKWMLPYILRLAGEYVVEILEEINQHLDLINNRTLYSFIYENPHFYMKIKSRIASYWDCYYREKYPNKEEYAGFQILQSIQANLDE
ncbi:hypothetical protein [Bacillus massiliigorillae]|uniref:hypothetical protein n=1 Tax=Bacillus massiliigorillae TaxID=1243664 RepID=UPI0005A612EC|nr:hypothetical protein [Bacillus massiliigorillae]